MFKYNTSKLRSFASNAQEIIPIILHHYYPHTSDYSKHKIAISKSLSIAQPLIVPVEKAEKNCIPLEEFLVLLDEKLMQEQAYFEEIIQFKDTFCGEFDRLCEGISDKQLFMFIRNQRQRVIDCVFDSLKFEKQQMITKFYDNMISGYDDEAIKKFEKIVCNTLWKSLLTPIPLGLIERTKNAVEKIKNEKTEKNIEEIASRMILFVKDHFKNNQIKLNEFENATNLKNILLELSNARKTCSIDVDTIDENKLKVIEEFKTCIKDITVSLISKDFELAIFDFAFNCLSCTTPINAEVINKVSKKFPRVLKSMIQHFKNTTNTELEIIATNFANLNSLKMLTLDFSHNNNTIDNSGMLSVAHLISKNKQLKTLNLNLWGWETNLTDTGLIHLSLGMSELFMLAHLQLYITGENIFGDGAYALSKSLQIMNKMKKLQLNFNHTSITTDAISHLAASITKMNQMKYLSLDFSLGKNSANNNSMKLFAQAISGMTNLCHLLLDFRQGNNEIADDGIMQLGQAITKSICIQQLGLYFGNDPWAGGKNAVTDKGIKELSQCIAHLKNIQQLELNFSNGNHQISDKGIQALAVALKNTNKILDLNLNFDWGKNLITDASMDSLADALKQMSSELSINFYFRSNNSPRVTANGESIIKNARVYKSVVFYNNE